jgi:hypothetical protein
LDEATITSGQWSHIMAGKLLFGFFLPISLQDLEKKEKSEQTKEKENIF